MERRAERQTPTPKPAVFGTHTTATCTLHGRNYAQYVRHVIESFIPRLEGRNVLLHEDNTAVVVTLTKLATLSRVMMAELRRMWYMLDMSDIRIRLRYIRSATNTWHIP
jgi:hypothetical protein